MAAKKKTQKEKETTRPPKTKNKMIKLHIGGGENYLAGWTNIDNNFRHNIKKLDIDLDLTKPLPFDNDTVDCIFYENFLEQLTPFEGLAALNDIRRVLKPNGKIRIEMSNLNTVPYWYNQEIWEHEDNWKKLESLLKETWFKNITQEISGASRKEEFKNLLTENEAELIAEAQKIRPKIPCFVLTYWDFDTAKKSIDFLTKYSDKLDIHIVENHSEFTETEFRPYMLELINKGKIKNYYVFDKNIGINAIEIVTRINAQYLYNYNYFMITDGDLISYDSCWLDELVDIIENNEEVFAVGTELDLSNLPSEEKYPNVKTWVPQATKIEDKNYNEGATGWCFNMYKTIDFFNALELLLKSNQRLIDKNLYCISKDIFKKKWVRTKNSKAYHLTWDVYSDLEHPYTKWKNSQTYNEIWNHDKYSNYTLFNQNGINYFTVNREITEAPKVKLHVGCGTQYKEGWVNIDNNSDNNITNLDLNWDLRNPLPYNDNSVDYIFNEHLLEHLTVEEGLTTLMDFKRVLKPGGILRIAMPDLEEVIRTYNNPNWKKDNYEFFSKFGLTYIQTKAELININFRSWGHKWLYDWEELERRLKEAGFKTIQKCKLRDSKNEELKGLETRDESTLIAEAIK